MMPMAAAAFGKAGSVAVPVATDPYWDNVVFLAHGEGADGSTSFFDRSKYARAMTVAGAAQVDTDIVVGDSPSIKFDADANYLSRAYGSELNINSVGPDFCFECFAYFTTLTGVINDIYGRRRNDNNYKIYTNGADLLFATYSGTTQTTRLTVAHGMAINTVYHIAIIRVGTTYYAFVDGVLKGSSTSATGMGADTTPLYLGQSETDQPTRFMRGNLNWLRITMGVPRYNVAGFAVPSLPMPTTRSSSRVATPAATFANVQLLCGFNGADGAVAFTDESAAARTATFAGNAQLDTAQSKFGTASLLLDGTGDFITFPHDANLDLPTGATSTDNFCMEAWVRIPSIKSGFSVIMSKRAASGSHGYDFYLDSGVPAFLALTSGSSTVSIMAQSALAVDEWHHVAVTATMGFYRLFVNGILSAIGTRTAAPTTSAVVLNIGRDPFVTSRDFLGWIDEARYVKGEAVYTENFVVPAAAFPRS